MDLISLFYFFLGNVDTLVTVLGDCPLPATQNAIVIHSPGIGDVLFFELFHTSSPFHPPSLSLPLSPSLSLSLSSPLSPRSPQLFQTGDKKKKAPGQSPCQVLRTAMLSILLSYLKNVEYQQCLSLLHCQLLYEAILVE